MEGRIRESLIVRLPLFAFLFVISAANLHAQVTPVNDSGVTIGHIHLNVKDIEVQKKMWVEAFGATPVKLGPLETVRLPGIFIIFTRAEPTGPSQGSTVDHYGLAVKDLAATQAKVTAAGGQVQGQFVNFPDGVRLELLEDTTLTVPVVGHHIHLFTSADAAMVRDWYVKTFGGTPGTRRGTMPTANFPAAATFPGGEVDVLAQGGGGGRGGRGGGAPAAAPAAAAQAPTKGRAIDHIGFEVKNLEEFCKKLQAQGITFETPYRDLTAQLGLKIAFIADPVGTRIELTEGLAGK